MTKRTGPILLIAVFLCIAFASLLLAEGGSAPFSITSHDPPAQEVAVPLDANVQAVFDDDVNAGTVTNDTFVVHGHLGGLASGTLSYIGGTRTVTLDPVRAFHAGEVLRVSATSGVSNTGGAPLTPYGWQFTAGEVYSRCLSGFGDIGAGLTGVAGGSVAWGDYDNDGDLDILLTGHDGASRVSKVYRNDGGGAFSDIGAGLTGVYWGSVAWGDYDNDGNLDILLTGWDSADNPVSEVYRNDGGGGFSDIVAGLSGVVASSVAWGDVDNDGDLDILLTGAGSSEAVSKVYRNDGGAFSDIGAGLTGVFWASAAWGDYDNDGDLDILLTGEDSTGNPVSKVYRNDGPSAFTDIGAALAAVQEGSVAWGDVDNDGDLDILLTGWSSAGPVSKVYRNDGVSGFADIGAGLTGLVHSSVAWGDVDNDGDLDMLLTGWTGSTELSTLYRNDGPSGFTDIGAGLTDVAHSSVAWGDVDNDGDLDILLTGNDGTNPVSKVYRNADCLHIAEHQPVTHEVGVPLTADVRATFTEDVNAGTVTSDTFVVHGHLGGLASGTLGYDVGTRTVTLAPDRTFHAGEVLRVSATSGITSTYAGPLTPYGWQFTAGPIVDRRFAGFADIGAGLTGVGQSSVGWGDAEGDGDLDILLTGSAGGVRVSKVYRNDGASGFTDIGAGLTGVTASSVAWGDYDNDGDLDILLTGYDGSHFVSTVYRNQGGGTFGFGAALLGVADSSVAWGDYDNDGDLDILLTGVDSPETPRSRVYRNDGGGAFTNIGAGLTEVSKGSVVWGDYDNDGDLDILLTGWSSVGPVSKVYRNDGGGAFSDIAASLPHVRESSVAWGDYDNDGDLDILLTGSSGVPVSEVYRNDGGGAFTDIDAGLTDVEKSSVAWGDYDNDGDLDILLTGVDSSETPRSRVYRNDGGGAFTDIGADLAAVRYSSAAWGDYDDDGDLDILLTGCTDAGCANRVSKVYRNKSRPQLGSVTPSSGSGPVGATTHFTTTWKDPDGWQNLKQCYFHIGASPSLEGNVTLLYNAAKDKLWLLNDTGTTWVGGCQPGDVLTTFNGQAVLDCSQTAVQGAGDTLSVTWAIEFKPGFEGAKKLGLKCKDRDKAKAKGKWRGTWTVE